MYQIKEYKDKIISCLTDLERATTLSNKAGRFDLNKDAEEFYRGLLNLFFDWNLENLNTGKDPNHEGADLGDCHLHIAIQITSENNPGKVHKSIRGFKNKSLKEGYTELYIMMFKGKGEFPNANFAKTVDGAFTFAKDKHIIDHSDLCAKLKDIEGEKLENIYKYLEKWANPGYSGLDESIKDLGIIGEIFEYIQKNKPGKATDVIGILTASGIDLVPKIKLNFPIEQQDRVQRLMKKTWDKKEVVRKFIANQVQEDEISVNELIFTIQDDYCKLKGTSKTDAQVQDILIIQELSQSYLPEKWKKNIGHVANAQALVFFFFEFCYIGDKTEGQKYQQTTLFD